MEGKGEKISGTGRKLLKEGKEKKKRKKKTQIGKRGKEARAKRRA